MRLAILHRPGRAWATGAAALAALWTSSAASGAIIFYTDEATFASAVDGEGLILFGVEDFEEANIGMGQSEAFDDPLDASTDNGLFSPGDILSTLRIQTNLLGSNAFMEDPRGTGGLYLRNASGGTTSKNVSHNFPNDSYDIITLTATSAMSLDLITLIGRDGDVEVDVWSDAGALLGNTIAPGSGAGTFLGVLATGGDTLDRVNLFGSSVFVGADNIAVYGVPACPADLDGSGAVDFGDILAILAAWGNKGGPEDLDGNGIVDFGDLLIVLAAWGPCE